LLNSKFKSLGDCLCEFHTAFGHAREAEYKNDNLRALRKRLIREEAEELLEALETENEEHVLKELCDLLYVTIGLADTYGWDYRVAFNRVHSSNMSKLDRDGLPVYDSEGKVLKSENYQAPVLVDLVNKTAPVPDIYLISKK
jgi:predicted HAD superfamily Cof-like phosphohydrolase